MNKKLLIGAVVGALILFIWQFVSWGMANLHASETSYTSSQDALLEAITAANLEEGKTYFLPTVPPGTSMDEQQKLMESRGGQPWARVTYNKSLNTSMGMNLFRGFVADLVALLLLCWVLMKIPSMNMQTAVLASIAIGVIGYISIAYLNSIWFEGNSIMYLVDAVVSWGAIGAWLGWWLPRGEG